MDNMFYLILITFFSFFIAKMHISKKREIEEKERIQKEEEEKERIRKEEEEKERIRKEEEEKERIRKEEEEKERIRKEEEEESSFKYNSSDPFNGILMHLNKKTNGNIQMNHTIDITSSNLSCGKYETLVDFENINGHTHISGNPKWLQFDLKGIKAQINSYLIKSAHTDEDSHSIYYLKNWKIEISLDGNEWTTIDEKSNDSYLNGNYQMHLYELNQLSKPFRYIRIISNGGNWNHEDFTIGKFELFGNIIE